MLKQLKIVDYLYIFVILISLFLYFTFYKLNVDSIWTIYVSDQMLQGKTLYKDLIEVNPPLKFIYTLIPSYVAQIFSVSKTFCFVAFISILIFLSYVLSYKILNQTKIEEKKKKYLLFSILFILTIISITEYGEKEHLFMIFTFPYILISMFRNEVDYKNKLLLITILFASLGLNLKPHFFLIIVIIEIILIIEKKDIFYFVRWDFFLLVFIAFLYLILIYLQFPQYLKFIVPFALKNYSYFNNQPFVVLMYNFEILIFIIFLYLVFMFNKKIFNSFEIKTLIFLALGLFTIYLLQQKGWYYQRLPFFSIVLFLCFYTIFLFYEKKFLYLIFGLILILIKIYEFQLYQYTPNRLISILEKYPENAKIHIYSTDIARGQPIVSANNQIWTSRFNALYFILSIQKPNNEESQKYVIDSIYEDLEKFKPHLLIFENFYFDFFEYFSKFERIENFYIENYNIHKIENYIILEKKSND